MLIFFFILIVAAAAVAVTSYNALQTLAQHVKEKSSNVQVAISKKMTLVNQLIDVVKNYQESEQLVQLKVSQDTAGINLEGAYRQSGTMFTTIQGLAEKFPNLKANEQYHRLTDSIQGCEQNIQYCRETYNQAVKAYNTTRMKIPTIFIAKPMGFSEAPYMEFDISGIQDVTAIKEFKTDDGERLQQMFTSAGNKIASMAKDAGKAGKDLVDKIKDGSKDATSDKYTPPNN